MSLYELAAAVGLGALAAAVGTPTGVSGGLLLLPVLLTVFGLGGTVASATNLLFNVVSTPAGILRQPRIDRTLTKLLVGAATPAAVGGALVNVFLLGDSPAFRILVAVLLVAVGASLLVPRRRSPGTDERMSPATRRALLLTGVASGLLGGFYGLGGAVLAAPAALLLTGWPVARVAGAALVTTLTVSVTGLATYATLDVTGQTTVDTPHWPLGLALGAGGLVGGWFAARYGGRLPDRLLRRTLAVLVTLGALRLVFG
ncbi:sulfite exporter TauE/SafE family protein [Polymorphospora rubra]|uniref:sulfite exporter TauE/SafE family protein n=1 Tax=Polymorphospora rubra TaxID=338584 RepID=UPI0033F24E3B